MSLQAQPIALVPEISAAPFVQRGIGSGWRLNCGLLLDCLNNGGRLWLSGRLVTGSGSDSGFYGLGLRWVPLVSGIGGRGCWNIGSGGGAIS